MSRLNPGVLAGLRRPPRGRAGHGGPGPSRLRVPDLGTRKTVIAWILAFLAGPVLLAWFAWYLCCGPRRPGPTDAEIAEFQVLADIERHEDLF